MLTSERLRELLDYDPETGVFTWRVNRGRQCAGSVAGTPTSGGYRNIGVDGSLYREHRLAWLYVHGKWPAIQTDHANRIRNDNRFTNLRECTHAENGQNLSIRSCNTSGHPGVSLDRRRGKWYARIRAGDSRRHLGYFTTAEEAAAAYREAKKQLHPFQPVMR